MLLLLLLVALLVLGDDLVDLLQLIDVIVIGCGRGGWGRLPGSGQVMVHEPVVGVHGFAELVLNFLTMDDVAVLFVRFGIIHD